MTLAALILEDSPTQAHVIGQMLTALGWTYFHCETVREATEALTFTRAGVMLLDVHVGLHNTLLHLPRFRALAPGAPIALMTAGQGGDVTSTVSAARQSGAEFVLQKPFTQGILSGVLIEVEKQVLAGGCRKHILVIDDSRTVCFFVKNGLDERFYRVTTADCVEAAFDSVDIAHVDLVLCDVFMPGMGGIEGAKRIKATWPAVKVISMSGGFDGHLSEAEALRAAISVGADSIIAKPFTISQLAAAIGETFQRGNNDGVTWQRRGS